MRIKQLSILAVAAALSGQALALTDIAESRDVFTGDVYFRTEAVNRKVIQEVSDTLSFMCKYSKETDSGTVRIGLKTAFTRTHLGMGTYGAIGIAGNMNAPVPLTLLVGDGIGVFSVDSLETVLGLVYSADAYDGNTDKEVHFRIPVDGTNHDVSFKIGSTDPLTTMLKECKANLEN